MWAGLARTHTSLSKDLTCTAFSDVLLAEVGCTHVHVRCHGCKSHAAPFIEAGPVIGATGQS